MKNGICSSILTLVTLAGCGSDEGGSNDSTAASTTTVGFASSSTGQDGSTTDTGTDAGTSTSGDSNGGTTTTGGSNSSTSDETTAVSSTGFLSTNTDGTTGDSENGTTGMSGPADQPENGPYSSCKEDLSCDPGDWTRGLGPMDMPEGCVCSPDCEQDLSCPDPVGVSGKTYCWEDFQGSGANLCKISCRPVLGFDDNPDCYVGMRCWEDALPEDPNNPGFTGVCI